MTRFQVYTTGGELVKTIQGLDENDCSTIDRLGVSPPWQIAYYDDKQGELICKFSATRKKPGSATRAYNEYYARLVTEDPTTNPFAALSRQMNRLFQDSDIVDSGERIDDWEPSSEGDTDPKWINHLTEEYSFNPEDQRKVDGVVCHLQSGSGRLALGFRSYKIIYTLISNVYNTDGTVVYGSPAKLDSFPNVKILLQQDDDESDFTPLDDSSEEILENAIDRYVSTTIDEVKDDFSSKLSKQLSSYADKPSGTMSALYTVRATRNNVSAVAQNSSSSMGDNSSAVTEIMDPIETQASEVDSELRRSLSSEVKSVCTEQIEALQEQLYDQLLEYVQNQVEKLRNSNDDTARISVSLNAAKQEVINEDSNSGSQSSVQSSSSSSIELQPIRAFVDSIGEVNNAREYLTTDQWDELRDDVVDLLDDELEEVNQNRIDYVATEIESNIDDYVSELVSNSQLSEEDVRAELSDKVTIRKENGGTLIGVPVRRFRLSSLLPVWVDRRFRLSSLLPVWVDLLFLALLLLIFTLFAAIVVIVVFPELLPVNIGGITKVFSS